MQKIEKLWDFRKRMIRERLVRENYHITNTAKSLGLTMPTIQRYIKILGLKDIIKKHRGY